MKRVIVTSAAFVIMIAVMQSCAPNRKMPRPQRHPTPPGKFVMIQAPAQHTANTIG